MTDSSQDQPKPNPFGPPTSGKAPSPFDSPTEEFPEATLSDAVAGQTATGTSIPRTDDDLATLATEALPTYGKKAEEPAYSFASIPASNNVPGDPPKSKVGRPYDDSYGRGTSSLGLLLLRLAIGGTFIYSGLQKLTGWWGGRGIEGTKTFMEQNGWKQPELSGILATAGELGGGVLVVLGLITPLAAAALLATAIDAWLLVQNKHAGLQYWTGGTDPTIAFLVVLGVGAAAIILTGPGRVALDVGRGWATRPRLGSFLALLAAVAAAIATWCILHGGNPFH